jgi:hypothetical protein
MAKQTVQEQAQAEESARVLREMFPPGSTAKTVLRHVAGSGMTRWISVISPECEDVSWHVAKVLGVPVNQGRHEGIRRGGCGMDMGFDLVYSLSRRLYPDGFECVGERLSCLCGVCHPGRGC